MLCKCMQAVKMCVDWAREEMLWYKCIMDHKIPRTTYFVGGSKGETCNLPFIFLIHFACGQPPNDYQVTMECCNQMEHKTTGVMQ